jgi:hypothetical protein
MPQRRHTVIPSLFLESLEPRIAPAGLSDDAFTAAPVGSSILLKAGQGISTSDTGGSWLLYVEKGQAMIFTTDLNGNNKVDFNEITGIAAGDGLRLVSFVDINGDIVTNLTPDGRLTDSDGDASNGYDGKVVLNSRIESIVLRSVVASELDTSVPGNTVQNRIAKSTYSINGNIYAGGGLGISGSFGLQIDPSGFAEQAAKYGSAQTLSGEGTPIPSVGFIFTGSATGGEYFSFGTAPVYGDGPAESLRGQLAPFLPAAGQAGGDVIGIRSIGDDPNSPSPYHLGGIVTGNGGFGARGGDIVSVQIQDDIGGLLLQTGRGGDGTSGGNGGSIKGLAINNSINSGVVIQTGDGGAGLIGRAGQAGNIAFDGEVELFGQITVGLGRGGDGLGSGGTGTSISSATFTNINPGTYLPAGIVTTWRSAGDIGDQRLIVPGDPGAGYFTNEFDIDGDGFFDAVVFTDLPNQLFVAFGTASGSFDTTRTYLLPSPSYAAAAERTSAVVVLDANGDGLPDIVTAPSTGDGFSGLLTYLNRGVDPVTGAWLGFATPRYSPLPLWDFSRDTPQAVINLVAGDFDRDGIMDVGVVTMGRTPAEPGAVTQVFPIYAVAAVMKGLTGSDGNPDGYFTVDYGKGPGTVATQDPTLRFGRGDALDFSYVLKATASQAGDPLSDRMLIVSKGGLETPSPTGFLDRGRQMVVLSINAGGGLDVSHRAPLQYSERVIDGNPERFSGYGEVFNIRAADFIVGDVDGDGVFDAVAVGQPTGERSPDFLVAATLTGNADGTINQLQQFDQTNFPAPGTGYFGIALTEQRTGTVNVPSVLGRSAADIPVLRMVAGDFDGDPTTLDFALNGINLLRVANPPSSQMGFFSVTGFGQYGGEFDQIRPGPGSAGYAAFGESGSAFHTSLFGYRSAAPLLTAGVFNALAPVGTFYALSPAAPGFLPIAASSLSLSAGAGGWSLLGAGGAGGSIGGGVYAAANSAVTATGFAVTSFTSGAGGFGLLSGGRAGAISGVQATAYFFRLSPVSIDFATAGGGGSLLGAGGAGGRISQFSAAIDFWANPERPDATPVITLTTGHGGSGRTGGDGGSVLGRSDGNVADIQTHRRQVTEDELNITTGHGGFGTNAGGRGGAATGLVTEFGGGPVAIATGSGGYSAAGSGGAGGDLAVRPSPLWNKLAGDLSLQPGDGGDGRSGGAGGSIRGFVNSPTDNENPATLFAIAGNGGGGVFGVGGKGGNITDFSVTASTTGGIATVVAGRGGLSAGATGGAGGDLRNVVLTSESGAAVGVAGAGGDGLRAGGLGGAIASSRFNSGGLSDARVVAIAGQGGDAHGVSAATVQRENSSPGFSPLYQQAILALGVANGLGGNGGSITNFTQPRALQASVDLIAGNGGSTLNYGLVGDLKTGVGRGGSMTNINLANDAGLIDKNIAIRAYAGDFVQNLRDGTINTITSETGNVGVVVGAAGRVRNDLPVSGGVTGSVNGFKAQNIMSMVAGSVDRIAAISSVSGLQLQFGGTIIGAEKTAYIDPNNSDLPVQRKSPATYWAPPNTNGDYVTTNAARPGGVLWDGAVLARKYSGPSSIRVF